jgi:hypothetical protein
VPTETRTLRPGPRPATALTESGAVVELPAGWDVLLPGDAALTRRVKAAGPAWTVQEKVGRKVFSRGVWAPTETIVAARAALEAERSDPSHAKKLAASRERRAKQQEAYVEDFHGAVLGVLAFHARHAALAEQLATAVTAHATPVGSGTVARTERIPIQARAESAVIAWMRHQTTAYDDMVIPRVRGERRRVRRMLAERSKALLDTYRRGEAPHPTCPLARALAVRSRLAR